nr:protein YgfX [Rosenbergiella nectarea]
MTNSTLWSNLFGHVTVHADLWQTEIRPSRYAVIAVNGWVLFILVVIVASPWFGVFYLLKPLAIAAVIFERSRTLTRLSLRIGLLGIDNQETWYWQQQQWRLSAPLCWLPWGVMISWRSAQQTQHFWLMADTMSEEAWRNLRFYWLKGRHRQWK